MKDYALLSLVSVACVILLGSCRAYKDALYLQDMDTYTTYLEKDHPDSQIRKGDIIKIQVACKSPALAAPFNVKASVQDVDPVTNETTYVAASGDMEGYYVDESGNINFPVLGMLHVEGRTLPEVRNWIKDLIIKSDYIKEPIVSAEFANFQFTMIGEGVAGNYTVNSGDVNIFEAVAMAGGLSDEANRRDLWVIRTVDGTRKVYSLNLLSKSCYESPAFYLQQNDMVVVKPIKSKRGPKLQNVYQTMTMLMSFVTTAGTILTLLKISDKDGE